MVLKERPPKVDTIKVNGNGNRHAEVSLDDTIIIASAPLTESSILSEREERLRRMGKIDQRLEFTIINERIYQRSTPDQQTKTHRGFYLTPEETMEELESSLPFIPERTRESWTLKRTREVGSFAIYPSDRRSQEKREFILRLLLKAGYKKEEETKRNCAQSGDFQTYTKAMEPVLGVRLSIISEVSPNEFRTTVERNKKPRHNTP